MAKYRAKAKTWLSHECRMVDKDDVFEATFPKIKHKDGSETEMALGENLELVEESKADDKKSSKDEKRDAKSLA